MDENAHSLQRLPRQPVNKAAVLLSDSEQYLNVLISNLVFFGFNFSTKYLKI